MRRRKPPPTRRARQRLSRITQCRRKPPPRQIRRRRCNRWRATSPRWVIRSSSSKRPSSSSRPIRRRWRAMLPKPPIRACGRGSRHCRHGRSWRRRRHQRRCESQSRSLRPTSRRHQRWLRPCRRHCPQPHCSYRSPRRPRKPLPRTADRWCARRCRCVDATRNRCRPCKHVRRDGVDGNQLSHS